MIPDAIVVVDFDVGEDMLSMLMLRLMLILVMVLMLRLTLK